MRKIKQTVMNVYNNTYDSYIHVKSLRLALDTKRLR